MSRLFTPRAITDLEPKVRAIAAEVLDGARDRGEIDIVAEYSAHLPMMVIAEMLGIPMEARERPAPLLRPACSTAATPTNTATCTARVPGGDRAKSSCS